MCVSTLLLAPHPVPPGQQPPRILRFMCHIQAIKFSLVYRVVPRKGFSRQSAWETLVATIILLQHTSGKVT